jgi:DNA mismatch repair protein MutS2
MRVPLQALRRRQKQGSEPQTPGQRPQPKAQRTAPLAGTAGRGGTTVAAAELVLIGSTVDDAIDRIEKFLDAALLGDERRLRVVHGHGTGRLRDAVRAHLKRHPVVAEVAPAPDNEGGDGATIVELKD